MFSLLLKLRFDHFKGLPKWAVLWRYEMSIYFKSIVLFSISTFNITDITELQTDSTWNGRVEQRFCTYTSNWISVVYIFVCVSCFFSEVITSRLHRVCQWYVTVRTMKHVVMTKFTDISMFIILVYKKKDNALSKFHLPSSSFLSVVLLLIRFTKIILLLRHPEGRPLQQVWRKKLFLFVVVVVVVKVWMNKNKHVCSWNRLVFLPDPTRPDQTRPDQTRPDQTRPDQTRPDQTPW